MTTAFIEQLISFCPLSVSMRHTSGNADRMNTDELEPGLSIAIRELLRDLPQPDDPVERLCEAARESMRVRFRNSHNGGLVLAALRLYGLSWREISRRTGIPMKTARNWATPPPRTKTEEGT